MNLVARAAHTVTTCVADRVLTALWPMRAAALELSSTATPSTATGCATTGGAGHLKK